MLGSLGALLLLVAILAVMGTLAYGAYSAAPWVPLLRHDVERMVRLVRLSPGETLYDLGCGDGRLLMAAAERYHVRAVGFELALVPYCLAHIRRLLSPQRALISIRYQDFWNVSLAPADAVVCFLTPYAMRKLEQKIPAELKPGARFATYAFRLHSLEPELVDRELPNDTPIYLYTKGVQP